MPKFFPRCYIAQMHLYYRYVYRRYSISYSYAVMRICSRVYNNAIVVSVRSVQRIYYRTFAITLIKINIYI